MKLLNKLRVQLVLWTVTLEAILLLVFALILVFALQNSLSQQIDETLRLSAAQMNAVVDVALDNGVSRYEIPAEDTAALRGRGVMVWILDPSGTIVATVGEAADIPLPVSLPLPGTFADTLLSDDQAGRLFALPLQEGNRAFGTLVLATSLRSVQTFMRDVLLSLAIALPLVLMLSAAGGLFLANRALSPVASITATVRHISADDLSQRIHLNTQDDEIGQLANTFDAMLERLQNAFQRERQLTSDVSHELRTPLGLLKTQLSLARSRPREAAELLQMMRDMEDDVDRMTR
ncbi:MAG: HAMP domain-containing protein, partial [Chloroflexota bacterium]|nr:HAMP domain-containing protein [Chloroflexota bacterium]